MVFRSESRESCRCQSQIRSPQKHRNPPSGYPKGASKMRMRSSSGWRPGCTARRSQQTKGDSVMSPVVEVLRLIPLRRGKTGNSYSLVVWTSGEDSKHTFDSFVSIKINWIQQIKWTETKKIGGMGGWGREVRGVCRDTPQGMGVGGGHPDGHQSAGPGSVVGNAERWPTQLHASMLVPIKNGSRSSRKVNWADLPVSPSYVVIEPGPPHWGHTYSRQPMRRHRRRISR